MSDVRNHAPPKVNHGLNHLSIGARFQPVIRLWDYCGCRSHVFNKKSFLLSVYSAHTYINDVAGLEET